MSAHSNSLACFFDGEFWQLKENLRSRIDHNELFKLRFDQNLEECRQTALDRAKYIFSTPEIKQQFEEQEKNAQHFINKSLALGEIISTTDLSVGVKMGVMGWLFGGAVTNLGSDEHIKRWFQPLKNLEFTGMFCMSERGHGSNVRGILTEAHFDPATQEFIINTPCEDARKIYIGNALQGDYAAVFAQLYIKGESKGPHCFIVPVRTKEGLVDGVSVEDMGHKEGLNGVDNGLLAFHHVRIPRENLLNRYGDVSPSGEYSTSIERDGARFNAVLGALLGTRIALCFQAIASMKIGLEIAIKYGLRRRQFGPAGGPEQILMDYQTHQLRLMPRLATCLALMFTTRHAGRLLDDDIYYKRDLVEDRPLQALAAGLKAYATWESVHTLQVCRECCGGMGYMEVNRISGLKRDSDVFVTFEGDNVVMLQQVVKELLVQYGKQVGGNKVKAVVMGVKDNLMSRLKTSALALTFDSVTSVSFILKALQFKEGELLRALATRMMNKVSSLQEEPFGAWNDCLDHVTSLAWVHIHRVTLQEFNKVVSECENAGDKALLQKFVDLFAIRVMYDDRGWYLEQNYISPVMSKQLRDKYIELCGETSKHALTVVEAFRHPKICVQAPIAGVPTDTHTWAYYPDSMMASKAKL